MRLFIVSAEFPPMIGGIATLASSVAMSFIECGHEVVILTSVPYSPSSKSVPVVGPKVYRLPTQMNIRYLKVLPLLILALWICLIHRPVGLLAMNSTYDGLVSYVLRVIIRVKYVVFAHGSELLESRTSRFRQQYVLRVFANARACVANSRYTASLVLSLGLREDRTIILYPTLHLADYETVTKAEDFLQKYGLEGKRILLTAARMVPRKGQDQVLRALSVLRTKYSNLVYVVTGRGPFQKDLAFLAEQLQITGLVKFVGFISRSDLNRILSLCEVFVMPGREDGTDIEGFGIAFLEANIFGKPVIGTRVGGACEAILDGKTGILIDADDVDMLVNALESLLNDAELRHRLGCNGRVRVLGEFSVKGQRAKYEAILRILSPLN
jgi:phosphatidylinositol alpha-1,6-mannosyltransferase